MNYDFNPLSTPIEAQKEWNLLLWPYEENWAFNLYKYLIINEQFLKGTEKCIGHWYKKKSGKDYTSHRTYLRANFSKEKPTKYDTTWEYTAEDKDDPMAAFYTDTKTGQKLWLCPLWTLMWGEKPNRLYCSFTPDDDE